MKGMSMVKWIRFVCEQKNNWKIGDLSNKNEKEKGQEIEDTKATNIILAMIKLIK